VSTAPTRPSRSYGPEYGPEAIRRLEAGFSIVYSENDSDDSIIEEHADGRRFLVRVEPDSSVTNLRELPARV
jgi:hypothetical protein